MATNATDPPELAEASRARRQGRLLALRVGVLALAVVLWPSPSPAGQLRCANHKLSARDTERLNVTAGARAPAGVTFSLAYPPCNNVDFARASLESSRRPLPYGVTAWWTLTCMRGVTLWTCDAPQYWREVDAPVTLRGVARRVRATLDAATSLEIARPLIGPAAELLYGDPATPPPACTPGTNDDAEWRRLKGFSRPPPAPEVTEMGVSTERGTLTFGGYSLVVSYGETGEHSDTLRPCWLDIIVVT